MNERGFAALELALGFLMLLVPVVIVVLSFAPALERRVLVRSLATEAARELVLSDGSLTPVVEGVVWRAAAYGVSEDELRIGACGDDLRRVGLVGGSCAVEPGGSVVVTVAAAVDGLLPGGPDWVSYTHRQPVDPYRSRP